MGLYAGCDLHAKSNYWGVVDGEGKRVLLDVRLFWFKISD